MADETKATRLLKLRSIAMRKSFHFMMCVYLLLPFFTDLSSFGLTPLIFYALNATAASLIYAAQVKRPIFADALFEALNTTRQSVIQQIARAAPNAKEQIRALDDGINRIEKSVKDFVDQMERDYEKRGGYLGMFMGAAGVLIAQAFTGSYVVYGIISVMFYDTMSAVGGVALGRIKIPYSSSTVEGAVIGAASLLVPLFLLTGVKLTALAIPATAIISEAYGIEDNFTIPITTSVVGMVLGLRAL
ncbi:MAG: phosphatidate cytidylyltransferase [Thermoprotei archaeon]